MLILPSSDGPAALGGGGAAVSTAGALGFCSGAAGPSRCCSSIFCMLAIVLLSARGNTGSIVPSLVPSLSCPQLRSDKRNCLSSPKPSCAQMREVESGITGCASAVTIRKASALVYRIVPRRERLISSFCSPSVQGAVSTTYVFTAPTTDQADSRAHENWYCSKSALKSAIVLTAPSAI